MELDFRQIFPDDFLKRLLEEGKREDGRRPTEYRTVSVNTGSISSVDGSAVVRIGGACVVCGIRMELGNPLSEHPDEGYVVCSVDISHTTSSSFNQHVQITHNLSQTILEILLSSKFVDQTQLMIKRGKLCWVMRVELVCVSVDGYLLDAALLAAVAAIKNVKIPTVSVDDATGSPLVDLSLLSVLPTGQAPSVSSFAVNNSWTHTTLLDPTNSEVSLSNGQLSVAVTEHGELCGVYKSGGSVLSCDNLSKCVKVATKRGKAMRKLISAA